MTSAREVRLAIDEFVAMARRTQSLVVGAADAKRLEELARELRRTIDGARKEDLQPAIEVPASVRIVSNDTASQYTEPRASCAVRAYYGEEIVRVRALGLPRPRAIVDASGAHAELPHEARVLFGFDEDIPVTPSTDISASRDLPERAREKTRDARDNVIVHFVAGGTRRGSIEAFDPSSGQLVFVADPTPSSAATVDLSSVLAIFFARRPADGSPGTGMRVRVTLVNDRHVEGITLDYTAGGASLTLVPDPPRGNIGRIWVPAASVKDIVRY